MNGHSRLSFQDAEVSPRQHTDEMVEAHGRDEELRMQVRALPVNDGHGNICLFSHNVAVPVRLSGLGDGLGKLAVGIPVQIIDAEYIPDGYQRLPGVGCVSYHIPEGLHRLPALVQRHIRSLRLRDNTADFTSLVYLHSHGIHREAYGFHHTRRQPRRDKVAGIIVGKKVAEVHGALIAFRLKHDMFVRINKGNSVNLCLYPLVYLAHDCSLKYNRARRLI